MVKSNVSLNLEIKAENLFRDLYQRNELSRKEEPKNCNLRNLTEYLYPKEENVFTANSYQFGNNLGEGTTFGVTFTYGGRIILLDSLKGEDRAKVLEHETHHRHNPMDSEIKTREKTATLNFYPNQTVSPTRSIY